ncbi:MAG TPA: sulfurtransferase TusA family protein [Firmicutes bacterium]|nr:sulfurtransferase TusA family protein [Bacillota bacterium]
MNKEQRKEQNAATCGCPFCDDPFCPDPAADQYRCKNEQKAVFHRVDCIGLYCPVPVMRAGEEIARLGKGEIMELLADDPASAEDIPRWAKRAGHSMLAMKREDEGYRFLIRKEREEEN